MARQVSLPTVTPREDIYCYGCDRTRAWQRSFANVTEERLRQEIFEQSAQASATISPKRDVFLSQMAAQVQRFLKAQLVHYRAADPFQVISSQYACITKSEKK